jgi:hypothetical protein
VEGIISTVSGYCGGKELKPTYEMVSSGATGHIESLEVSQAKRSLATLSLLNAPPRTVCICIYWHPEHSPSLCFLLKSALSPTLFPSPSLPHEVFLNQVQYDPSKVTYEELLDVYWHQINPTQKVNARHVFHNGT